MLKIIVNSERNQNRTNVIASVVSMALGKYPDSINFKFINPLKNAHCKMRKGTEKMR